MSWFYHNLAYNPSAITQADINEFVSHYSAPGGMRDGFNYFRAFPQDAIQNINYSKTKLPMPILAFGAGYIPAFGGNVTINYALYGMKALAQNVTGIQVPNSGHWIPERARFFNKSPSTISSVAILLKLVDKCFPINITDLIVKVIGLRILTHPEAVYMIPYPIQCS